MSHSSRRSEELRMASSTPRLIMSSRLHRREKNCRGREMN